MIVEINENGILVLKEVFIPIVLESQDGEQLTICMRDTGFELNYVTPGIYRNIALKEGEVIT